MKLTIYALYYQKKVRERNSEYLKKV